MADELDFEYTLPPLDAPARACSLRTIIPPAAATAKLQSAPTSDDGIMLRGCSGRLYRFQCYSLLDIPLTGPATYVLMNETAIGQRHIAHVGVVAARSPVHNRARIRQRAAAHGATSIGISALGQQSPSRTRVARDVKAGASRRNADD